MPIETPVEIHAVEEMPAAETIETVAVTAVEIHAVEEVPTAETIEAATIEENMSMAGHHRAEMPTSDGVAHASVEAAVGLVSATIAGRSDISEGIAHRRGCWHWQRHHLRTKTQMSGPC
jgi:hypothetical protein